VGLGLGVGVVTNLVREGLDGDIGAVGVFQPALRLGAAHDAGLLEGVDEVIGEEVVLGAGVYPGLAIDLLEGGAEALREALVVDEALQAGELEVLAVEAQVVIEDAGEGALEDVCVLDTHGLVVHVEEDGFRGDARAAARLGIDHGVLELAVEVLDGGLAGHDLVREQVGEHLQEVGLTGAEEAGYPDADLVRGRVERMLVGIEEAGEVAVELPGDHVLAELLLDGGLVLLGHLYDAVDVTVDVALEHVLDAHGFLLFCG